MSQISAPGFNSRTLWHWAAAIAVAVLYCSALEAQPVANIGFKSVGRGAPLAVDREILTFRAAGRNPPGANSLSPTAGEGL